jgi:hypothetical protein
MTQKTTTPSISETPRSSDLLPSNPEALFTILVPP